MDPSAILKGIAKTEPASELAAFNFNNTSHSVPSVAIFTVGLADASFTTPKVVPLAVATSTLKRFFYTAPVGVPPNSVPSVAMFTVGLADASFTTPKVVPLAVATSIVKGFNTAPVGVPPRFTDSVPSVAMFTVGLADASFTTPKVVPFPVNVALVPLENFNAFCIAGAKSNALAGTPFTVVVRFEPDKLFATVLTTCAVAVTPSTVDVSVFVPLFH
ncbi:hypothetical protein FQR65_LT17946 [Abscondita terminalis]|nr:hypothetical protein FQR65_LT17946 [Abscondita terminalis]